MSPGDPDRSKPRMATPPPWDMLRFVWRGRLAASLRCLLDAPLGQQLCGMCPGHGIVAGGLSSIGCCLLYLHAGLGAGLVCG